MNSMTTELWSNPSTAMYLLSTVGARRIQFGYTTVPLKAMEAVQLTITTEPPASLCNEPDTGRES